MTPTEEKLIHILGTGLKLKATGSITPQTQIFAKAAEGGEGLGLDSVDVLEIAVLLDKHFGVMLEEESAEVRGALANIASLAAFIDKRRSAA